MSDTPERLLDKLCADCNAGLFTPEAYRDFLSMRDLYASCGRIEGHIDGRVKKEKIYKIYITLTNVIKYDFTDIDRITLAECIAGIKIKDRVGSRSLALSAAKYYDKMTAYELIRIGKTVLKEPVEEKNETRRTEALNMLKTVSRLITFGKYDKDLI